MSNVNRIRQPELGSGIDEHVPNPLYDWRLFPLSHVQDLQQPLVAFAKVENVAKDIFNKFFEEMTGNDWRIGLPQRSDEALMEGMCKGAFATLVAI